MRRVIAVFLTAVMCFSLIGEFAFAEDVGTEMPDFGFMTEGQPITQEPIFFAQEEPPFIQEEPPFVQEEPPFVPEEPPYVPEEPPAVTEQPPAVTEQPPAVTEQPPVVTEEPPVVTEEPPVVTEEPPVVTEEPPVVTEEPPVVTEQPPLKAPEASWIALTLSAGTDTMTGRFVAGQPETVTLTATVTRSDESVAFPSEINWNSTLPSLKIKPGELTESPLERVFSATAEFTGVLAFGNAVITAAAAGLDAEMLTVEVLPAAYKAVITDATGTDFEFALLNKTENTYHAGDVLTFDFTESEKNKGKGGYDNFVWAGTVRDITDTGENPVYVKANEEGGFTLYCDSAMNTPLQATGNIAVTLTEKTAKTYTVIVEGDTEEYKTVFETPDVIEDNDYIFYIAHPEDLEPEDEEFESKYTYSLPLVNIDGKQYNGYKLEMFEESKEFWGKTYKKYWMVTIPGERVVGDIVINANTCKADDSEYIVDLNMIAGKELVPFAEDENLRGRTLPDPEDEEKQDYYFYYMNNPQDNETHVHPIYLIDGVGHPLSPLPVIEDGSDEAEDSSLYKISGLTGEMRENVTVKLGYNVRKGLMYNNEEYLIKLPTETVNLGEDYIFHVRTYDMTATQLQVLVYVGTRGQIYPEVKEEEAKVIMTYQTDDFGNYAEFFIPHELIDGDITIEAHCARAINGRVKFADNYNVEEYAPLQYRSFEFTSPSFIQGTYKPEMHMGEFQLGVGGFSFEILEMPIYMTTSGPNVDGTSSDDDIYRYTYDFTGSTMDGQPVSVTPGTSYWEGTRFHQMFDVNGGQPLTGDVLIKAKLVPNSYECITVDSSGSRITGITNRETYVLNNSARYTGRSSPNPVYRYLFEVNVNRAQTRKIYLRVYNEMGLETKTYPTVVEAGDTETVKAQIYGDYVIGPVIVKALGLNEYDVYVTGSNPSSVSFPNTPSDCRYYNGTVATNGTDFVFTAPVTTKIAIKVGGTTLSESRYYISTENNTRQYIIPGNLITGDITIETASAPSSYTVTFTGNYELALPMGKTEPVQQDTVPAGENYRFRVVECALTITAGGDARTLGRELIENRDYIKVGDIVTIYAGAITDNLVINITLVPPMRTPVYSAKKTTAAGIELAIDTYTYLTLDNEKTMYMLIVQGEPTDGEYVCYDNSKMLWVESYNGYVWFEASKESPEDFSIHAVDLVDTLTDDDIRLNLSAETDDSDEPDEISEYEEIRNITDEDTVSCDVNEDGKINGEDLAIMRRIFNCDFEDFDDISMRCFVLADADNSGALDMRDAAVIKSNFGKGRDEEKEDKEEDEDKDEKEHEV